MITKIVELPNAWGWGGKTDRTGYEVYVGKTHWGTYCYYTSASAVADRIEKEHENDRLNEWASEVPL